MQSKINYQYRVVVTGLLLLIYLLAWHLQQNLLLNADVSWLMEASGRMLAGGTYQKDYFELNPPMILYLYLPAVIMAKTLHWPAALCVRLYIFLLSFLSLYACAYLSKHIFNPSDRTLRAIFLLMLAGLFCIFPIYEFGQRELLLLILSFPYFLLIAARQYGFEPDKRAGFLIGLFAGVGFAIKPYFLAGFLLIELYHCMAQRNLSSVWRSESIAVYTVMVAYVFLMFGLHQDYLTVIVPFVRQFYYNELRSPIHILILNDQAIYFYFSLSLVALFYRKLVYKQLALVLVLAGIGFYISYLLQSTYWYYHILPMFATAVALFGLIFFSFVTEPVFSLPDYIKLGLWLCVYAIYLMAHVSFIALGITFYPAIYFGLFIIIFSPLLYIAYAGRHLFKLTWALALIFFASYIFYQNVQLSVWRPHVFLLSNILLILSFILFLPRQFKAKCQFGFYALFGLILFSYPFYWSAYLYHSSMEFKKQYLQLVGEMNQYPGKSVYFLTDSDQFPFPALDYTHQRLASRFSALGGLPILKNMDDPQEYLQAYKENQARLDLFARAIVEDFREKKPDLIFVDIRRPNIAKHLHYFGNNQLDYIQLFSLNPEFKSAWVNYHYVKTIDGQPLYKFRIYAYGK